MFIVLLLAGIEKVVNLAIATDSITQAGLQPLSGKVLRLVMAEPAIEFDTIFIAHYHSKKPNLADKDVEKLVSLVSNSKRVLKEASNSISAGRKLHNCPDKVGSYGGYACQSV
jgi:ubiquinone biosynthesis protein UbiJ